MHQDSYNQRLRQIREKYGATIKETTTLLRSDDQYTRKLDSNYDTKYGITKNISDTKNDRKYNENADPSCTSLSTR